MKIENGQRFSRWAVIAFSHRVKKNDYFTCICDCGTQRAVGANNLSSGASKSCGCFQKERVSELRTTHAKSSHPVYLCWSRIRMRCANRNAKDFKHYGGRGIKVCDRWSEFENFWNDMSPSWEVGLSIERRDVNGNYEPFNCYWATMKQQSRNRRNSRILETPWGRMNFKDVADKLGIGTVALHFRLKRNWPSDRLFTFGPSSNRVVVKRPERTMP